MAKPPTPQSDEKSFVRNKMAQLYGLVFVQDYPLKVGGSYMYLRYTHTSQPSPSNTVDVIFCRPVAVLAVRARMERGPLPQDHGGH